LRADSAALAVVANNTANVSTPGYTEETVEFSQNSPIDINGNLVPTGVVGSAPISQRDRVLDEAVDQQTQTQAGTAARLTALDNLQSVFAAATSSTASSSAAAADISSGLNNFFGSLQQLEASPSDTSLRESVLSAAKDLANNFNTAAATLTQQQTTLDGNVVSDVSEINSLSSAIAGLNKQIQSLSPNGDAGTLEDQRQYDLQGLSKLIGIQQVTTERNGMTITTAAGSVLVLGNQAVALTTGLSSGVTHIYDGTSDITTALASGGGQIGGQLEARDSDIPSALGSLDTLAYAVGTAVNTQNEAGLDADGNAGGAIFSLPSSASGSALAISVAITDPAKIAAAGTGDGVGDGSNAAAMAAIAQQQIVGGDTPTGYFASFVASVGDTTANVSANNIAQQAALTQLQNQQSAISGVTLDTEATNMQNLEEAYQAASKVFAIVNTVIEAAINIGTETTY
jgi:flagellar hook-associated protein 1 FlgK